MVNIYSFKRVKNNFAHLNEQRIFLSPVIQSLPARRLYVNVGMGLRFSGNL